MFDQLFRCPHALSRQSAGPLLQERLRYLEHLASLGMARSSLRTAACYVLAAAECLRVAERPGEAIAGDEIQYQADLWAGEPHSGSHRTGVSSRQHFLLQATRFLRFLGRLQVPSVPPHPFTQYVAAFTDYITHEQGLSPATIGGRRWAVDDFLRRLEPPPHSLQDLTPARLDAMLIRRVQDGGYSRRSIRTLASNLRSFFLYAGQRGWCRIDLAASIVAPRLYAQESLPAGPSWEEVQRLIATTATDRRIDIRNRAILMLLAVYGFRASEVVRLRLDDLDWEQERLSLRRAKTRRAQTYPLSRPVGNAIIRYLKEVRPRSAYREVFLTHCAPIRPLSTSVLWRVVGKRLRAVSVGLPHHGPHALRHACATHLLEEGLSLKEIGDHLGHHHPDSTRIYAPVNLAGLREVADFDLGGLA
jgi:site-specific recombinase XerD